MNFNKILCVVYCFQTLGGTEIASNILLILPLQIKFNFAQRNGYWKFGVGIRKENCNLFHQIPSINVQQIEIPQILPNICNLFRKRRAQWRKLICIFAKIPDINLNT